MRGSIRARLMGRFAVNVTQVMVSGKRLAPAVAVDFVPVYSDFVFAPSILPQHTGGKSSWHLLRTSRAATGSSDADRRTLLRCRPVPTVRSDQGLHTFVSKGIKSAD